MDEYERIIKKIVEGQIRDFAKAHPAILKGIDWRHPHDPETALVNSLAKRILGDLLCAHTRMRVAGALLKPAIDNVPAKRWWNCWLPS